MAAGRPGIAVIIVNYGTAVLTVDAVESVLAADHGGRDVEVHVVDNASPGGDAEALHAAWTGRGWEGRVCLHLEAVNHGFGRGNNLVLEQLAQRQQPPDKCFLLNPDARLLNGAIAILADFLDTHPQVGAAGAATAAPGIGPSTSAFRFPSPVSEFSDALAFGPVARLTSHRTVPIPPGLATQRVDWVTGAAVMLRKLALEESGTFDPDFFLYFEEVELMFRLGRAGWEVWHVAEAQVVHHEGAATGVRSADKLKPPRPDYWYDSFRFYHTKTAGRGGAFLVASLRLVGWTLNIPLTRLRGKPRAAPARYVGGMWRRVLRPLLGLQPTKARQ